MKKIIKLFACVFESIKQKSKKNYYHNLLITDENNMKRTWGTVKKLSVPKNQVGLYSQNGLL